MNKKQNKSFSIDSEEEFGKHKIKLNLAKAKFIKHVMIPAVTTNELKLNKNKYAK